MSLRFIAILAALAASTAALSITQPGGSVSWTQHSTENSVKWSRDSNDPASFDIRLVASSSKTMSGALAIAASVNGSLGELSGISVAPTAAKGCALVRGPADLRSYKVIFTAVGHDDQILAESDSFSIVEGAASSTSARKTSSANSTASSTSRSLASTSFPTDAALSPSLSASASVNVTGLLTPSATGDGLMPATATVMGGAAHTLKLSSLGVLGLFVAFAL